MSVGDHRSFAIPHPHDPGVVLGNLALAQDAEPVPVEAVVSLCRIGTEPILPGGDAEHVRVWLVDSQGANANLHYVLDQAARQVLRLRQEGKRVLLHCLAGQSRTPAVAAVYSHLATGTDSKTALHDLRGVLTSGWHLEAHPEMHDAVYELATPAAPRGKAAGAVSRRDHARDVTAGTGTTEDKTSPRDDAAAEQVSLFSVERDVEQTPREFLKEKGALSRVRGLLLGLAIGDTLGRVQGKLSTDGPLRAGVSTQLACFTAEGTIRGLVRGDHKGIYHGVPSVVWHAYCRWAALQGLKARRWGSGSEAWPDGWLAQVPVLAERRGSAPATVTALAKGEQGDVEMPTTSRGCHALTRTLPVAVLSSVNSEQAALWAHEMAALTHGDPAAQSATAQAVALVSHCLISLPGDAASSGGRSQVQQALRKGLLALRGAEHRPDARELDRLAEALQEAIDHPADAKRLAKLAPDATAPSALFGGVYVAASFSERKQVGAALRFAAGAPDGDSVACMAGALLGAAHGVEALPVDLISRHELAWVLDTLARDLVTQLTDSPSGDGYTSGWDPNWWDRYPGW
jgi:ADP-ribosylglycohydrolase